MENKITTIREKIPQIATLPDGFYFGIWSGYVIDVNYNNKQYELLTESGVKGINIHVVVEVKDGVATFDKCNR